MTGSSATTPAGAGAGRRAHGEPLIVIRDVVKTYGSEAGEVVALGGVDLEIKQGEFVAIVGTSGSGKSTLMNILGCLDRPTSGTYTLAGIDIGGRSSDARAIVRNRLVGFVFQGFNLLPRTSAQENVELPLLYRGAGSKKRHELARKALEAVGLGDRGHHHPNQLSGGQQQRVAIARAIVTEPPLLLADEPTGNLDTRTSHEVLALLQKLNRELGTTIVLVTHEHDIAACAERVVTFRDGCIISDERTREPVDAAALVSAPVPDAAAGGLGLGGRSGRAEGVERRAEPGSFGLHASMLFAFIAGALLGGLYDRVLLGEKTWWIPLIVGFLLETRVGWRSARRAFGRLTVAQRVRTTFEHTIISLVVWGVALGALMGVLPRDVAHWFAGEGASRAAQLGVIAVLVGGSSWLMRYLLVSFWESRAR